MTGGHRRAKRLMADITWLPALYNYDNNDKLRVAEYGYSDGVSYSRTGLVYTKSGEKGKLTTSKRAIKPTTVNPTTLAAAQAYTQQEWDKKQRTEPYKACELPTCTAEEWRLADPRRWPAICENAKNLKEEYLECSPVNPWHMQPKANGDRTMARYVDGKLQLFSRTCLPKAFHEPLKEQCATLIDAITAKYPDLVECGLDGECFVPSLEHHQDSRSHMSRTVNRHPDEDRVVLHIFDLQEYSRTFQERQAILAEFSELISTLPQLTVLESAIAVCVDDVYTYRAKCFDDGWKEGIVLRRLGLRYTRLHEYRHHGMLKFKNIEDGEYEVTGYRSGEGNNEGCVVWECCDPKNRKIVFTCQHRASLDERRYFYQHGEEYVGHYLTIEFGEKSKEGVPKFPIGVRFRPEDDLPPM